MYFERTCAAGWIAHLRRRLEYTLAPRARDTLLECALEPRTRDALAPQAR